MTSHTRSIPAEIDAYVYQPLADGYIRLIELFSDTVDAPLQCRIFTCCLNDAPLVSFEALSYVWGPQEPLYDLLCGDIKPRVLRVGPNLRDALLHLRCHPSTNTNPRVLWVDRICINQDDIEERASQVQLMCTIYRRCWQALVWLGMDDSNTEEAFECARFIHKNGFDEDTPLENLALFRSPAVSLADLRNYLSVLAKVTHRPWFERAWTFQEIILPSTVLLVCGESSMTLECLEASWTPAYRQESVPFFGHQTPFFIFATRKIEDTFLEDGGRLPPHDLERLLSFRREAKMSDPRDFIFSLLGLFSPSVSRSLSPNYSTSIKDLFTAVAKHIIRASGELRILCSVESPKHIDGEAFPSWVPDWRASSESIRNVHHDRSPGSSYRATRESVLDYDPSNGNRLHLYGIPIGAVDQAGRYNDFHSISDFNLGSRYDHTNQPITAALRQAQTLDFGAVYGTIGLKDPDRRLMENFFDIQRKSSIRRRKCKQCPIAHNIPFLPMVKAKQDPRLARIVGNCSEDMKSRAFFTTDSRYLGFGPNCTAVGDQVFLLIGSDIPFILRPVGNEFELVGACYVHGIMYGEGLCQNFYINNQFYPGSTPSGTWDFSDEKVPTAEWRTIEEKGDNAHIGGSVCRRLARTTKNTNSEELKDRETRSYLLCESGRSPVSMNTRRVIIK